MGGGGQGGVGAHGGDEVGDARRRRWGSCSVAVAATRRRLTLRREQKVAQVVAVHRRLRQRLGHHDGLGELEPIHEVDQGVDEAFRG